MKKKILFICPYPENTVPGQRLKYEQYFEDLKKNNFDVTVKSFFNNDEYKILYKNGFFFRKFFAVLKGYIRRIYQVFFLYQYSLVYIFLNVTPLGGSFFEKIYRFFSKKIIYDIDDLVYLNKSNKENNLIKYLRFPSKYYYLMEFSDHVITCTSYLNKFVRKYNKNTTNISSTVNTKKYTPKKFNNNNKNLVLGWTGSFSTLPYLDLIYDVIDEIQSKYNLSIIVISSSKVNLEFKNSTSYEWNSNEEVKMLKKIDIGLYPLPDEEWVKGKSGLKAIQFMALGIPVIATDTEINKNVVINNKTGFLVNSKKKWIEKISLLIENKKLRRKMSKNSVIHVSNKFSVSSNKHKYLDIINNLIKIK